jgi:hypothetical protein
MDELAILEKKAAAARKFALRVQVAGGLAAVALGANLETGLSTLLIAVGALLVATAVEVRQP